MRFAARGLAPDENELVDRTAYDAWRALPFPEGSADDELDEAHADLVYWDTMTAEAVVPMVEGSSPYGPGALDFRAGLAGLHERLVALRERASGSEAESLDGYIAYAEALIRVIRWAAANAH